MIKTMEPTPHLSESEPKVVPPAHLKWVRVLLRAALSTFFSLLLIAFMLFIYPIFPVQDLAAASRLAGFLFLFYTSVYGLRQLFRRG